MSASRNRVELIGRLGKAPEVGTTPSTNQPRAVLRVATNERVRGPDGKLTEHTEWHRVVVFGPAAANARERFLVGDLVLVEGKIRSERHVTSRRILRRQCIYARDVVRLAGRGDTPVPNPPKDDDE